MPNVWLTVISLAVAGARVATLVAGGAQGARRLAWSTSTSALVRRGRALSSTQQGMLATRHHHHAALADFICSLPCHVQLNPWQSTEGWSWLTRRTQHGPVQPILPGGDAGSAGRGLASRWVPGARNRSYHLRC